MRHLIKTLVARNFCGIALGILGVVMAVQPVHAQAPSPPNFPFINGGMQTEAWAGPIVKYYHAMGMNGHVAVSHVTGANSTSFYIANPAWDQFMQAGYTAGGPVAIQKNGRIWLGDINNSHLGTFDTMATVLNQTYMPNTTLVQILADTNDHVYVVYNHNPIFGFGVIRFGSTFVPDWHNYYPGQTALDAQWGIDQRLYVQIGNNNKVTVISPSGARLKDLDNVGTNFTVFPDHGLGIFSMSNDSVKVVRTDSNMVVQWAKKFRPSTNTYFNQPYTVLAAAGVATTSSNELLVCATERYNVQTTINCSYPYTEMVRLVLLDDAGNVVGNQGHPYSLATTNSFQIRVSSTPYGDALISYDYHTCITSANIVDRYASVVTGHYVHQTCSGVPASTSSFNFTPTSLPSLGALGTVTAPAATLLPDNLNFGLSRFISALNTGSAYCVKPCVAYTTTPLGGGQVAFNDDAHGFHSIFYDFGDGSTGTTNDPVHTYPPYGTWPVSVIVTNGCGADTVTYMVHPCSSAVVNGPTSICAGSTSTYNETSGLNPVGLSWLVNGVSMGSGSSFNWTPSAPGTYTLSTVYFDSPCRDTVNMTVNVDPGLPVAGFTYVVTAQRQLTFTNTSTGAMSYSWSFGDGTTSTVTNPVKTYSNLYANNGNFTICLIATNGCGSDTFCFNFNCPIPYSSFTVSSTNLLTATLSNSGVNGTINWDFGDGSTGTGVVTSHTFPAPGTYTICQTVSNACATHSSCQQVLLDTSSTSSQRTFYQLPGYDYKVDAIAAQPSGDVLAATSSNGSVAAVLALDPTGAIRSLKYWNNSYSIRELHPMSNGNFAFFSYSHNGTSNQDPTWGELDKFGNLIQAKYVPIGTSPQLLDFAFKTPSGYLFVAESQSNPSYYARLNQNLQLQYIRSCTSHTLAALEAPDGTIWLVQKPPSNSSVLEFVHLDGAGVGFEKYTTSFLFGGNSAFIQNGAKGFVMDCNGMIYGMMRISDIYNTGAIVKLGVVRFNTVTGAAEARTYRVGSTSTANNPYHDPEVRSLVKYPNGHFIGWGGIERKPSQVGVVPDWEKFAVDLDPSTFTLSVSAFGAPNLALTEKTGDACSAGPAQCYTLSKSGSVNPNIEVHRHSNIIDCQLPASVLAPQIVMEYANTSATYSNTAIPSTLITAPATNWTRTFTSFNGSSLRQCASTCPSGLVASFTYSVTGNTLTVTSTSTPGAMLSWSIGGQSCLANATTGPNTLTITLPCGTYPVTLTASDQCSSTSATQTIVIGTPPVVSAGSYQTVCPGASATFTATSGLSSYLWSNGATTGSITVSTPGNYSVTATDANGCTGTASVTLANHTAPTVSAGTNQTVCPGANATFTATSGFSSYLWSNGATTGSITVSVPTTYTVTVTDANGCTGTASVTLANHPAPTVSAGTNQTVCPGAIATFTATSGFSSYLWSNGATTGSITVSTPGNYSVTATDANGCTGTASVTLANHPASTVSAGSNQTVCPGASATFTASPGFSSYLWSNGATTGSITVSAPATYTVTATDANGCTVTASVTLANYIPTSFTLGNDTSFCMDTTWALTGPSGANSYQWSTGATSQGIAADTTGSYSLNITDANGCITADTIQLQLAADCVWPGDADHDGLANNADLLAIAFSMANSGPIRPNATTSWYGQPCTDWVGNLPSGANFKHQDCNGSGTVEPNDTMAIHQNYGLTHNKAGGLLTGVPVWIEPELDSFPVGDTVFFRVHWGDAIQPVTLGQGLAFTLNIAPAHVAAATLYGRYPSSFLGNGVPDLLTLTVPFPASGDVHHAVSRQDHAGRSGHGAVLRIGFLPDQVIPITQSLGYIPIHISGITAVDQDFTLISCTGVDDSILVYDPLNSLSSPSPLLNCTVFPVPTSDVSYLDFGIQMDATVAAELTDMHGRLVSRIHSASLLPSGRHRFAIPTDQISEGVYMVQLRVNGAIRVMKLVVAR